MYKLRDFILLHLLHLMKLTFWVICIDCKYKHRTVERADENVRRPYEHRRTSQTNCQSPATKILKLKCCLGTIRRPQNM